MLGFARIVASIISGIVTIGLGALALYVAISPPTDAAVRTRCEDLAFVLSLLGVVVIAALAIIDDMRDRVQNKMLASILEKVGPGQTLFPLASVAASRPKPTTFREQAFNTAAEIQGMVNAVGDHPPDDDEYKLTIDFAESGLGNRVRAIREKVRNLNGYTNEVKVLIQTFPIGVNNLRKMARTLERLANSIPSDIPADASLDDPNAAEA